MISAEPTSAQRAEIERRRVVLAPNGEAERPPNAVSSATNAHTVFRAFGAQAAQVSRPAPAMVRRQLRRSRRGSRGAESEYRPRAFLRGETQLRREWTAQFPQASPRSQRSRASPERTQSSLTRRFQ